MADDNDAQAHQHPPEANPDLKGLDRLVGVWEVSGGAQRQVSYEWMESGFFLIERVDLEQYGQRSKGIEIIGDELQFGAVPSEEISLASTPARATHLTTSTSWRGTPSRSGAGRRVLRRITGAPLAATVTPSAAPGTTRAATRRSRPGSGSLHPSSGSGAKGGRIYGEQPLHEPLNCGQCLKTTKPVSLDFALF